jgi:hypothetical protein
MTTKNGPLLPRLTDRSSQRLIEGELMEGLVAWRALLGSQYNAGWQPQVAVCAAQREVTSDKGKMGVQNEARHWETRELGE